MSVGATPGPWDYHRPTLARPSAWIFGQDERPICELNDNRNEYEANARLIAAAPDMFDALCELVDDEVCRLDHHGYCQAHSLGRPCGVGLGREALAKAKGQQP